VENTQAPAWFADGRALEGERTYSPRALDRYGERLAWSLAVALAALTLYMYWQAQAWIASLVVITSLCLGAGLLITYGNWMERKTVIEVSEAGLRYRNPLREVRIAWPELLAVSIYPRGDGWRVVVESEQEMFSFQTLTTLKLGWGRQVETGVEGGQELASTVVGATQLAAPQADRDSWVRRRRA